MLLLFVAMDASAGKARTKSNNSNDRVAPDGVVLQATAAGANACFTGTGHWSWAVSPVGTSDAHVGIADDPAPAALAERKADEMPNRISMNVTVSRVAGSLSVAVGRSIKNKNGHVTLNH